LVYDPLFPSDSQRACFSFPPEPVDTGFTAPIRVGRGSPPLPFFICFYFMGFFFCVGWVGSLQRYAFLFQTQTTFLFRFTLKFPGPSPFFFTSQRFSISPNRFLPPLFLFSEGGLSIAVEGAELPAWKEFLFTPLGNSSLFSFLDRSRVAPSPLVYRIALVVPECSPSRMFAFFGFLNYALRITSAIILPLYLTLVKRDPLPFFFPTSHQVVRSLDFFIVLPSSFLPPRSGVYLITWTLLFESLICERGPCRSSFFHHTS